MPTIVPKHSGCTSLQVQRKEGADEGRHISSTDMIIVACGTSLGAVYVWKFSSKVIGNYSHPNSRSFIIS